MSSRLTIQEVHAKSGITYLRTGIVVAFFLRKPLHENIEGVLQVFEMYLSAIPTDAIKWAGIGAGSEEWRPFTKNTFDKCRSAMVPSTVKKRAMTAIEIAGSDQAGDAPIYAFTLIGAKPDMDAPNEMDLVEMCFPSTFADPASVEKFVATLREMATKLNFVSGYASPALLYSEVGEGKAMVESRGLAMRYPGLDVQKNKLGCMDIDHRIRGARWVTFLGADILKKLGGQKKLRAVLSADISIDILLAGVMIRSGTEPELGDRNMQLDTPLLRSLAKALEPVTMFMEPVLLASYFADRDEAMLTAWERRFLD